MAANTVLLETCASAIRVLARREYVFGNSINAIDLTAFNKKLDPKIYEIFSDNKYYHQETTHLIPSRNRKTFNRRIQRSEAIDGAIKILGRGPALNEFISVVNGTTLWLVLNQEKLERLVPDFSFSHFQNFSNIAANLKIYGAMLSKNIHLSDTQKTYVAEQITEIKISAAALSALISNPLVFKLTNFFKDDKRKLAKSLEKISQQGKLGKESNLTAFIQEIQEIHSLLGHVFAPELLKPVGVAIAHRRHTTARSESPLSRGLPKIVKRALSKPQRLHQAGQLSLL